jgi:lysophospholipase L1-like esterase
MTNKDRGIGLLLALVGLCEACAANSANSNAALDSGSATTMDAPGAEGTEGSLAPAKYVALGSSFAAGPMIPDAVPDQSCGRSTGNYAHLVAAELGLDLTEASCVGATTDNVATTPQLMNPLQIDVVTPDTRVITISIGGNDVALSKSFVVCGMDGAKGKSCLDASIDAAAPDVDSAAIASLLDQVENKLVGMLGKLKQAAPAARIYLVSYPMILPDPATPCPPDVLMQAGDASFLGKLAASLQAAFASAATAAGVDFVDVYGASQGHDACAAVGERWVEGQASPGMAAYHPNATGMRAQAELIVTAIRNSAR